MNYRQYISQIANQQVVALVKDIQYQNYSPNQLLQLAHQEIAILLGEKAHLSTLDIVKLSSKKIAARHQKMLDDFLAKRQENIPLPYITSKSQFCNSIFEVNPATLIPRPETEELVNLVVDYIQKKSDLLTRKKTCLVDIGTGSGCIIVSIIKKIPPKIANRIDQYAIDISREAINTAKKNADQIVGKNHRIKFSNQSFQNFLPKLFQDNFTSYILVANLPYLSQAEYQAISPEVREQEPKKALFGGQKGYEEIIKLIDQVAILLSKNKQKQPTVQLFLEISPTIYLAIKKHCVKYKFPTKNFRDLSGKNRFLRIDLRFINSAK